jgi:chromosome segregation ATPase
MTVQGWNLLFSAITAGLVLVGGIWLRYVVTQQLKAKDTTIETLNAAIKLHEAEIAALKGDRAPAIAAEHKIMKEFVDQMAAQKQQLEDQVKNLTASKKADVNSSDRFIGETEGLKKSLSILRKHVTAISPMSLRNYLTATGKGFEEIVSEINSRESAPPTLKLAR